MTEILYIVCGLLLGFCITSFVFVKQMQKLQESQQELAEVLKETWKDLKKGN